MECGRQNHGAHWCSIFTQNVQYCNTSSEKKEKIYTEYSVINKIVKMKHFRKNVVYVDPDCVYSTFQGSSNIISRVGMFTTINTLGKCTLMIISLFLSLQHSRH